jgi:uncharacterized protein YdaU (DUF1376 family)
MRAAWWWIDRWRKSTAFLSMTAEEQGIYRNLLDGIWLFEGAIPDASLFAIAGANATAWERSWPKVQKWFRQTPEGWVNETAFEMMQKTRHLQRARGVAGKKGAAARWQTHDKRHGKGNGKAVIK